jgi:ribose transport system ATP-binding protein
MSDYLLEMRQISKAFSGVPALKGVSFACQRGRVHALVGENGAGKSTLMKILAGAVQADAGEIIFKGQTYTHLTTRDALNLGISVIYQELALIPYLSVAENIFLGREPRRGIMIQTRALREQAAALLEKLGVTLDVDTPVHELTIAKQQMVEIAKSLSMRADVVVMDEPSAILAGHELEQLFVTIQALKAQGVAVIYISHRLEEVFRIADEVTVLKDGEVVGARPIEALTRADLVQMMVGRSLDEAFPRPDHPRGAPVLVVERIVTDAIHDASLTLHTGEILGIAGMVGSGRTELARALFGADRLRDGRILLNGRELRLTHPKDAIAAGLALVPEDRKQQGLFTLLPIRHNVSLPVLDRVSKAGILQRKAENALIERARQQFDISMASPDQEVQYLSGGNQQKVVLAKWLETRPAVIILDEPTRGVDVGAKFEIYQIMRQLTEQGVAILMISSELPEVLGMSDRILVMRDGRIVGEFSRDDATEAAIIELATTSGAES